MVEINLLPWRQYARAKKRGQQKILALGVILCSLIFCVSLYGFFKRPTLVAPPNNFSARQRQSSNQESLLQLGQKIKFVGYLRQAARIWGIVVLPDGEVRDVQAGSILVKNVRVESVAETQLGLIVSGKYPLKIPLSSASR